MSRFGNLKYIQSFSCLWNGLKTVCCFKEVFVPMASELKKPPCYEIWACLHMHGVCWSLEHDDCLFFTSNLYFITSLQ